jgi:hypothetical protein
MACSRALLLNRNRSAILSRKIVVTELDVLETALDMIKNESHWTHHAFARDSKKRSIPWSDESAKAWDLFGAVSRACLALGADNKIAARANTMLKQTGKISSLAIFNDTSTHEEVVTFLEDVIINQRNRPVVGPQQL